MIGEPDTRGSHALVEAALAAPITWLSVERANDNGRACRDYAVYDAAGDVQIVGRAFPWQRDIVVRTAAEPHEPVFVIRRRRSFPLTGKLDVYDARATRIGIVSRSGAYRDGRGRVIGAFRDARTLRDFARETAFIGIMNALTGVDGDGTAGSGPTGFVWSVGDRITGTLTRATLPFGDPAGVAPSERETEAPSRLRSIAERFRHALRSAPTGWKLQRTDAAPPGDPRLTLAAALFAIELSHW